MAIYRHSLYGATWFSKVDLNKRQRNVKNTMMLICAKLGADPVNTLEITSHITKWPALWPIM